MTPGLPPPTRAPPFAVHLQVIGVLNTNPVRVILAYRPLTGPDIFYCMNVVGVEVRSQRG